MIESSGLAASNRRPLHFWTHNDSGGRSIIYAFDAAGKLTGWTRTRVGSTEEFTAEGLLVSKTDADGQPVEARRVRYVVKPQPRRPPILEQQVTDEVVSLE